MWLKARKARFIYGLEHPRDSPHEELLTGCCVVMALGCARWNMLLKTGNVFLTHNPWDTCIFSRGNCTFVFFALDALAPEKSCHPFRSGRSSWTNWICFFLVLFWPGDNSSEWHSGGLRFVTNETKNRPWLSWFHDRKMPLKLTQQISDCNECFFITVCLNFACTSVAKKCEKRFLHSRDSFSNLDLSNLTNI